MTEKRMLIRVGSAVVSTPSVYEKEFFLNFSCVTILRIINACVWLAVIFADVFN